MSRCKLCLAVLLVTCVGVASAATVTETAIGSLPLADLRRAPFVMAPSQRNVATVVREGTSERVVAVGYLGPPFDRILPRSVRWVGDRLVYVAAAKDGFFLVDGARTVRLPAMPVETAGDRPLVSADAKQYMLFVPDRGGIAPWLNGVRRSSRYERILFVPPLRTPDSSLLYAVQRDCVQLIQGHTSSARLRWTVLSGVFGSPDGGNVYVWGVVEGRPKLARNGRVIFDLDLGGTFAADRAGENWAGLVDETSAVQERTVLVINGKRVSTDDSGRLVHELYLSPKGGMWSWIVPTANDEGAIIRMPGRADVEVPGYAARSFTFSDDGARTAYLIIKNGVARAVIDGKPMASQAISTWQAFTFGPASRYAYVAGHQTPDAKRVSTDRALGPPFSEVTAPRFTAAGAAAYAAKRQTEAFVVIDDEVVQLKVDELVMSSFAVNPAVRVLARRGAEIVELTITPR
ncbi:MAG TPA: hypothetical protein VED01_22380 [Burkholderiales bacterium]|nr:hypothetical protein [Burkholderiales bacterium]